MSNNETKKDTTTKLYLANPIDFDGTNETKLLTTVTLSKYVNELFRGAFVDYVGCTIQPNMQNPAEPISLELYFAPNSDNGKGSSVAAFCPAGTDTKVPNSEQATVVKNNYVSAALQHNVQVTNTSTMQITSTAIDMLYDLMGWAVKGRLKKSPKSFSDCGVVVETSQATQIGMARSIIYNIIRGVDIDAIMKIIFGDKSNNFEFQVIPVKPAIEANGTYNSPVAVKWLYSVVKLDKANFSDLMNELGFYNKISDFGIMTEGF